VGDDAGGKDQSCFLRCGINRSQQTAACDARPAGIGINSDVAHSREVNHHAAIACAETRKAMPSAADSGKNSGLIGGSDGNLHVAYICAACDKAWRANYHAVPNDAGVFVGAFARAQQIAFESSAERRVSLFAGFDHRGLSLQNVFLCQR
jgi:hypothetical protein